MEQVIEQITSNITPFISGAIALVISLWIKDSAGRLARGVSFKFNRQFNEGDEVIIDSERAIIIKIGMLNTVFGFYRSSKNSEHVCHYWRFVPNERIAYLRIEKIVSEKDVSQE